VTAYQALETRFRRIAVIDGAQAVLHWDRAVMMPPGGAAARTEQLAVLSGLSHELLTDREIGDLLDAAEATERVALGPWQRANLREMRRVWRHANALPGDLVEALARAASECELTWREARAADDFARVLPPLRVLLALVRDKAAAKADALGVSPYEALLDAYDPGQTVAAIERLYAELKGFLPEVLERVLARQRSVAPIPFDGPISTAAQRQLGEALMVAVGFDTGFGRLDVSHHPFTGGVPDDVRITTRYKAEDFSESLMAMLHETGHALYERGLPADWRWQPVGEARGMTLHESQSLLIEMQACRGIEFATFALPIMRRTFGKDGPAWTTANLLAHTQRVEPGLIRVEADEVTYPFHVMLRYDVERALLSGDLDPADLPGTWRDAMRRHLAVEVPDDRDGCMQDIHWFHGDIGYFPTYTLGALAAAQLFQAAVRAEPAIPAAIGGGDFQPLLAWLRRHVHGQGSLLSTEELLRAATGAGLGTAAFRHHLERRYLD
jgi:carboxypeptidase Taq